MVKVGRDQLPCKPLKQRLSGDKILMKPGRLREITVKRLRPWDTIQMGIGLTVLKWKTAGK